MISEKRNKIERYLFTAVFNNAIFDRNNTGGTLTITKDDTESIIQFSDRPFRQTENINFDTFVSLFDTRGNDSFEEDPPNGVLTHDEEQRTYIIRLLNSDTNSAIFSLELLQGETHNLNTLLGRMNLFVDNDGDYEITLSPFKTIHKSTETVVYYINYFKIINSDNQSVVFSDSMTENTTFRFSYNKDNNRVYYLNNIMFEQNGIYKVELINSDSFELHSIYTQYGYVYIVTIENEETYIYTFSPVKISLRDGR